MQKTPTLRTQYPRIFELANLWPDCNDALFYFNHFEKKLWAEPKIAETWRAREAEFQRLDGAGWAAIKAEAEQYLVRVHFKDDEAQQGTQKWHQSNRKWSQLIDILNQARGYIYLLDLGCSDITFIPRAKLQGYKSPDLEAKLSNSKVICEVKTIGMSDFKLKARAECKSTTTEIQLPREFFSKLDEKLKTAEGQFLAYSSQKAIRVVFMIINFDDWLGQYKRYYYGQIDAHLASSQNRDYQIVFFNGRTAFHESVSMNNAMVLNE